MGEQKKPVTVTREVVDGQYVQTETVAFDKLSDLRVQDETLSISNSGATFFGVGPKKFTLSREVDNDGADPTSSTMLGTLFTSRIYTFKVTVPGWVDKAYPLEVGAEQVEPTIDGATISWQIPMARAMSVKKLVYKIDFFSYMDVTGTETAERVPSTIKGFDEQDTQP
jgi:hypothetical protein